MMKQETMGGAVRLIKGCLLVSLVGGALVSQSCKRPGHRNASLAERAAENVRRSAPPEPVEVDAEAYYEEWAKGVGDAQPRHNAWRKYQNQPVVLSGEVARVSALMGRTEVALRGPNPDDEVICALRAGQTPPREGRKATLSGIGDGWLVGPTLRNCAVLDVP